MDKWELKETYKSWICGNLIAIYENEKGDIKKELVMD